LKKDFDMRHAHDPTTGAIRVRTIDRISFTSGATWPEPGL